MMIKKLHTLKNRLLGEDKKDTPQKEESVAFLGNSKTADTAERNKADLELAVRAWQRVKASDSS